MMTPEGLSALEAACGLVFGGDVYVAPRHRVVPPRPEIALIDAMVEPLRRPPCVVAFSGGRDSSLVLAAALAAARRECLAPPVALTLRFPHDPDSQESEWQERVIAQLGINDWVRVELAGGLDVVGAEAQRGLIEHGPLFPANAHLLTPMLEHAAGGTIVSGLGGDELFGLWQRRRLANVAARRERPSIRDAARLVGAVAPPRLRLTAVRRRERPATIPYLRADAQARLNERMWLQRAHATLRWDHHVLSVPNAYSLRAAVRDIGRVAALGDVEYRAPLLTAGLTESLAAAGGWRGFGGRSETLRALFSNLLSEDVLSRRSKATFSHAFFTDQTRRFAQEWSGDGLDESVVDPVVLRRTWSKPVVDFRSALLLQSAWCHDHAAARC